MKIHVICKGYDSDRHICAVTLSEVEATELVTAYSDGYEPVSYETFDTDKNDIVLSGKNPFNVPIYKDGSYISVTKIGWEDYNGLHDDRTDRIIYQIVAKDHVDAARIAIDLHREVYKEAIS